MRSMNDLAGYTTAAIGLAAGAALLITYVLLETLRPKMVTFEPLTAGEEGLVNFVGVGLLLALIFCAMAVYRIIRFSARTQRLSPYHLLVIAGGVITALFIFGDVALLNDIGKQYEHGLSQPEWGVLYAVLAFQLLAVAGLLYAVLFTLHNGEPGAAVSRDSTVFLLAQVVGVLCGGMGLAFTVLNFFFPRSPRMMQAQIIPTLVVFAIRRVCETVYVARISELGHVYDLGKNFMELNLTNIKDPEEAVLAVEKMVLSNPWPRGDLLAIATAVWKKSFSGVSSICGRLRTNTSACFMRVTVLLRS